MEIDEDLKSVVHDPFAQSASIISLFNALATPIKQAGVGSMSPCSDRGSLIESNKMVGDESKIPQQQIVESVKLLNGNISDDGGEAVGNSTENVVDTKLSDNVNESIGEDNLLAAEMEMYIQVAATNSKSPSKPIEEITLADEAINLDAKPTAVENEVTKDNTMEMNEAENDSVANLSTKSDASDASSRLYKTVGKMIYYVENGIDDAGNEETTFVITRKKKKKSKKGGTTS